MYCCSQVVEAHRKKTIHESKFLGGDMQHTHMVKGLDFVLLNKVRVHTHTHTHTHSSVSTPFLKKFDCLGTRLLYTILTPVTYMVGTTVESHYLKHSGDQKKT